MASYAREPRAYELMAILVPDLADENLTGAIDAVSKYITDVKGAIKEVLTDSPWGRRRLAYTIRFNSQDYRDGIYVIWHFDLEPSQMGDIERELKLDVRVIRYLIVHDDPKWGSANEGNQPPAGEEGDAPATRPSGATRPAAATRPVEAPAAEVATTEPAAAETADTSDAAAVTAEDAAVETPADALAESAPTEEVAVEDEAAPAETTEEPVVEEAAADEAPAADEVADAAPAEEVTPSETETDDKN